MEFVFHSMLDPNQVFHDLLARKMVTAAPENLIEIMNETDLFDSY
jgi:hypothetical protein